jgi:hypothetical protein
MSNVPDFFQRIPMRAVTSDELDGVLAAPDAPELTVLFLWGLNCPNCDIAKRAMLLDPDRLRWPSLRWMHCNVYDDPAMATRFGLHGIPVFLVFRGRRPVGRITSWPGIEAMEAALAKQVGMLTEP